MVGQARSHPRRSRRDPSLAWCLVTILKVQPWVTVPAFRVSVSSDYQVVIVRTFEGDVSAPETSTHPNGEE